MIIKLTINQLLMGRFEKFLLLHDPQTPLYQENITIVYLPKGPDRMGLLSYLVFQIVLVYLHNYMFTNTSVYIGVHAYIRNIEMFVIESFPDQWHG